MRAFATSRTWRPWAVAAVCLVVSACDRAPAASSEIPVPPPIPAEASSHAPAAAVSTAVTMKQDPFAFDAASFEKKRAPRAGDWLARFPEPRQSFDEYTSRLPKRPTAKRGKIVLQPLGAFDEGQRAMLGSMRELASIFFGVPVTIAPSVSLPKKGQRARGAGWTQHHAGVLLDEVLAPRLPDDAICYLGITMVDLYPKASWNFVFGQASLDERVGVYSLARFLPGFTGQPESDGASKKALRRSIHILAHETGHMFSLPHCTEYECVMNGSNSLEEMDRQVDMLCPSCLRKLQWNLGFDVLVRYEKLRDFYRKAGLEEQAAWMDRRLGRLR